MCHLILDESVVLLKDASCIFKLDVYIVGSFVICYNTKLATILNYPYTLAVIFVIVGQNVLLELTESWELGEFVVQSKSADDK